MAADEKWYFTKEQLANTPSRRCGIDADKELSYRQQAANFIQDMGQRLVVTQLCINTAIVYMHRFYVFHSLSQFHRNAIAAAALFLAAKVEEQPRKLEHVIKVAHMCLHRDQNTPDPKSDQYLEQAQDLVFNENVLLQTLGFDVAIDHPHTHVVRCCQLVKGMDDIGASKDLAQTSYFMASNSLHLTTMCLQYKPTVVACFCIHLACKWSNWEIPQSNEGKYWFWYVDRTVTAELLQQLTAEFLHIFDRCPSRLKKKIMSISEKQSPSMHHPSLPNSPFDVEPRKVNSPAPDGGPTFQSSRPFPQEKDEKKPSTSGQSRLPQLDAREYREKKERERLEREKLSGASGIAQLSHSNTDPQKHHSHHHKGPASSSQNPLIPGKHPPSLPQKSNPHHSHHHRPDPKLVQQQAAQRHPQSRQRPPPPVQPGIPYNPHSHPNPQNHQKDMNSMIDTSAGSSDLVQSHQEPQSHQSLDKSGNNNHSLHRRSYDPRHKLLEHRKEDPKNYQKYGDQMRVDRQRKPDSLEQRSEEVRKLIEKPLPPPKPRQDQQPHHHQQPPQQPQQSQQQSGQSQKEDYAAAMLKQSSHHSSKYHEKLPTHNTGRNALPPDYSKFPVPHKQQPSSGLLGHSQSVQNLPKDLKNGAVEDVKCDKRPRLETENPIPSLPVKHKSLFSPEKVPPSRETIIPSKTKLPKQKTPPMVQVKAIKQERIPEISGTLDFTSSTLPTSPQPIQVQRRPKIPDISITEPDASQMRLKMEDPGNFDIMKMFGKIPEPTLSLRDIPGSTNGRGPSSGQQVNEHLKISNKSENLDSKHTLTNGMESLGFRNESHHLILDKLDSGPMKTEYLSPMKSVQGISALLQEPLAPMPSLLSQSSDSGNFSQTFSQASIPQHSESIHQSSEPSPRTGPPVKEEFAASTVDISVLSGPAQVLPEISASSNPPLQHSEKKSEHHKSEKKKKKEKHKHKDKDKSKEKHKHKHKDKEKDKDKDKDKEKDKEKEKERDKDKHKEKSQKSEDNSTMPIKITIAKDKLNLSTDNSSSQERKSPKLMLKKPKERLKHETSVQPMSKDIQGSLKIKIRTSGGVVEFPESRKRERERENIDGGPAAKKSTSGSNQGFPGQQQRTTERQNGRHYGSGSNKVRGSIRGGGNRGFNTRVPSNFGDRESYYSGSSTGLDHDLLFRNTQIMGTANNRQGRIEMQSGYPTGGTPQDFFYPYPPPNMYPGGYYCDPSVFYQQYQQQYSLYSQGNVIMTADGLLDTSVPPPNLPGTASAGEGQQLPPLPAEPPPTANPPPPPPPE